MSEAKPPESTGVKSSQLICPEVAGTDGFLTSPMGVKSSQFVPLILFRLAAKDWFLTA
jgi:hypothetical protein